MPAARRRLLFLAHRIPYPPVKGEKIRAWHMLDRLARTWEVELGCLVDDPADWDHLPALRARCAGVEARPLPPRWRAGARALLRARPGQPLSLGWFHDPGLFAWVREGLRARRWDAGFVYSSGVAHYLMGPEARAGMGRRVLDFVDVDSAKWSAYAQTEARFPMRQVWAREARTLLAFERRAALDYDRSLFVSAEEAAHFAALAPDVPRGRLDHADNGVDLSRFDPALRHESPFGGKLAPGVAPLVFTGTMDYRPNVDAVAWFAREVMPILAARGARVAFWIVGANPAPAVRALAAARGDVFVTGPVPDVRPYIAHAAVSVAPLRIARGIQNKVLEAMAMARPVVASGPAFEGVRAVPGRDLLVADDPAEMAARVREVLAGQHPDLGERGRAAVMAGHDWAATLQRLDAALGV